MCGYQGLKTSVGPFYYRDPETEERRKWQRIAGSLKSSTHPVNTFPIFWNYTTSRKAVTAQIPAWLLPLRPLLRHQVKQTCCADKRDKIWSLYTKETWMILCQSTLFLDWKNLKVDKRRQGMHGHACVDMFVCKQTYSRRLSRCVHVFVFVLVYACVNLCLHMCTVL